MPSPETEQLTALGLLCHKTRVEQNLALELLSEQLRIPEYYLVAIEQGKREHLPELVYLRGFVRKYTQILGLEEDPLVKSFFAQSSVAPLSPEAPILEPKPRESPSPLGPWLVYGLVATVAVVGLSALWRTYWPGLVVSDPPAESIVIPEDPAPVPPPKPVEIKPTPPSTTVAAPQPTTDPVPPPSPVVPAVPTAIPAVNLQMRATEDSWMRVVIDGKTQFEGVLAKGDTRAWQGKASVKLRLGNAGGVMLTYNNQDLGPAGQTGQVIEKIFKPIP